MNWTEEEDLKLVSAWLHNSIDSVKGNAQKGNDFWKKIVAEFNSHVSVDRQRTVSQCKTHYTKTNKLIVHFNGCWIRMKRAHGSGESDDQVMERAHAIYKREAKEKPFTFDYWWKVVKDQPKWSDMLNKYLDLMAVDTSGYTDARRQRHENALKYLETQLFI